MADGTTSLPFPGGQQGYTRNADGTFSMQVAVLGGGTGGSQAVEGNSPAGVADTGNPVKIGGRVSAAVPPTAADGTRADIRISPKGSVYASLADPLSGAYVAVTSFADASSAATDGISAYTRNQIFNGSSWDRLKKPSLTSRLASSAATTNATVAKAAAGDLFKVTGMNAAAAPRYLKLYNKASAPNVGTDIPVWTEYLPAQSKIPAIDFGGQPMYFSAGIAYAITGGPADNDTTAIAAGDILALNLAIA